MPRTLFLADDSVTVRKVVELAFQDTDVRVVAVGSGREAIERLATVAPDIVLADVVMPGPSGYDICRAVKASVRPVPVLLLAGTFEPFDAEQARACGADGHVTKPFDSRLLVERVEALLGRRAPEPEPEPEPAPPSVDTRAVGDAEVEALFDDLAARAPEPLPVPAPEPAPAPPAPAARATTLTEADIDAVARAVVERLSERVLREIAWDVVPDVAEVVVRERLRELERETD